MAGDVDGAVFGVEDLRELVADAGVATCYDVYLASLVREVLFCKSGFGQEERLASEVTHGVVKIEY